LHDLCLVYGFNRGQAAWSRWMADCAVEFAMPGRSENEIASGFGFHSESMHSPSWYVRECPSAGPDSGQVIDEQRDFALKNVKGFRIVSMNMQRDCFTPLGALIDQTE